MREASLCFEVTSQFGKQVALGSCSLHCESAAKEVGIALTANYNERQARVVDDDLKDVKPGDQGEYLVRGNTRMDGSVKGNFPLRKGAHVITSSFKPFKH